MTYVCVARTTYSCHIPLEWNTTALTHQHTHETRAGGGAAWRSVSLGLEGVPACLGAAERSRFPEK